MPTKGNGLKNQFTSGLQNPSFVWKTLAVSPVFAHLPFSGLTHHHGC